MVSAQLKPRQVLLGQKHVISTQRNLPTHASRQRNLMRQSRVGFWHETSAGDELTGQTAIIMDRSDAVPHSAEEAPPTILIPGHLYRVLAAVAL